MLDDFLTADIRLSSSNTAEIALAVPFKNFGCPRYDLPKQCAMTEGCNEMMSYSQARACDIGVVENLPNWGEYVRGYA
jgi:hypothetical protein